MKAARDAAEAVHRTLAKKIAADGVGRVETGFVRQLDPLQVELATSAFLLQENEELLLSHLLEWWMGQFGVALNDEVLLAEVSEGVWLAFDVRSEQPTPVITWEDV